jgi:hypothetical protein
VRAVGELEELVPNPWDVEYPEVLSRCPEFLEDFKWSDTAHRAQALVAVATNVARTAPLRLLLAALAEIPVADANWAPILAESGHFLVHRSLQQSLPGGITVRDAVELELGYQLIRECLFVIPLVSYKVANSRHGEMLRLLAHPAISVFGGPLAVDKQYDSNLRFFYWALTECEAPCAACRRTVEPAPELDDVPIEVKGLLTPDARPAPPVPFSAWELYCLRRTLEEYRKASYSRRLAARALEQSLGPRLGAALAAWDQLGLTRSFARNVRAELVRKEEQRRKW